MMVRAPRAVDLVANSVVGAPSVVTTRGLVQE